MRRLRLAIAALALFAFQSTPAFARDDGKHACEELPILLNSVALNGAAGTRTFSIKGLTGYSLIKIDAQFTRANTGTLTFVFTGKSAKGKNSTPATAQADTTLTTCTLSAGTCTLNWSGTVVTPSLSADKDFTFRVDLLSDEEVTGVVTHGGTPGSGDIIHVTGRKCVG